MSEGSAGRALLGLPTQRELIENRPQLRIGHANRRGDSREFGQPDD